ncbi:hypothetical protein ACNKHT_14910 [Shigella flexneri]
MQALMLLQESIGKERRPLSGWLAIRAFIAPIQSERERSAVNALP